MSDERLLMRAIDISRLLGVNDRTIARWHLQGYIDKKGRGEYCLLSVYKYYRQQLVENIEDVKVRIEESKEDTRKKSLQAQKLESSIKIITANAKIKEYEVELLQSNLVNRKEAQTVYKQGIEQFRDKLTSLVKGLAVNIAELDNRHSINSLLQTRIEDILKEISH